jgi:hypothetical protein
MEGFIASDPQTSTDARWRMFLVSGLGEQASVVTRELRPHR